MYEFEEKFVEPYIILLDKTLGNGAYGDVFTGYHKEYPEELLAIKRIKLKDKDKIPEYIIKEFKREYPNEEKVLRKLKHENIIKLHEVKMTKNYFYMITELCSGGDL